MIFERCKCGKRASWNSGMSPQPCDVCPECGSTYAPAPDQHADPIPHDPRQRWRPDGTTYWECARCYKKCEAP